MWDDVDPDVADNSFDADDEADWAEDVCTAAVLMASMLADALFGWQR